MNNLNSIKQKMQHTEKRNSIIANNIANINTPKFTTKDIKPLKQNSVKINLNTTNNKHIPNNINNNKNIYTVKNNNMKLNGNNVNLESEILKMNQNNIEHQQAINLYNKVLSLFKMASSNN